MTRSSRENKQEKGDEPHSPPTLPTPPQRSLMNTIAELESHHIHQLETESGIAREVIAERSVRTIRRGRDLPKGFAWRQRRRMPGILFTAHRPNGETDHFFRPDEPDPEKSGLKYEARCKALGAPGNVLDVHPS